MGVSRRQFLVGRCDRPEQSSQPRNKANQLAAWRDSLVTSHQAPIRQGGIQPWVLYSFRGGLQQLAGGLAVLVDWKATLGSTKVLRLMPAERSLRLYTSSIGFPSGEHEGRTNQQKWVNACTDASSWRFPFG